MEPQGTFHREPGCLEQNLSRLSHNGLSKEQSPSRSLLTPAPEPQLVLHMTKLRPRASKPLPRAKEKAEHSLVQRAGSWAGSLCSHSCLCMSALGLALSPGQPCRGGLSPADTPRLSEQMCQQVSQEPGLDIAPHSHQSLPVLRRLSDITSHKYPVSLRASVTPNMVLTPPPSAPAPPETSTSP